MASNANEALPSGRPAVSSDGDMVDSPHGLSPHLLHSHGGIISYGAQGHTWYNFCIRLQFLHKISKWLLFNNMKWLEPLDHILQDSFVNGPLRHSPGVHQCGLPNGGGGEKSLRLCDRPRQHVCVRPLTPTRRFSQRTYGSALSLVIHWSNRLIWTVSE